MEQFEWKVIQLFLDFLNMGPRLNLVIYFSYTLSENGTIGKTMKSLLIFPTPLYSGFLPLLFCNQSELKHKVLIATLESKSGKQDLKENDFEIMTNKNNNYLKLNHILSYMVFPLSPSSLTQSASSAFLHSSLISFHYHITPPSFLSFLFLLYSLFIYSLSLSPLSLSFSLQPTFNFYSSNLFHLLPLSLYPYRTPHLLSSFPHTHTYTLIFSTYPHIYSLLFQTPTHLLSSFPHTHSDLFHTLTHLLSSFTHTHFDLFYTPTHLLSSFTYTHSHLLHTATLIFSTHPHIYSQIFPHTHTISFSSLSIFFHYLISPFYKRFFSHILKLTVIFLFLPF